MPPYLAIPYFHLSKLPLTTKVALTGFSLAVQAAILFVAIAVFGERTDYETVKVKAHFGGSDRLAAEEGRIMEVPYGEPSRRAIYDIVHPHSFMMPLIYFVLCHLMEMTVAPKGLKVSLYLAGFAAMMAVVFGPLLVWSNLKLAFIMIPSVVVMAACFLVMLILPTWQMWFGGTKPAA